MNKKVFLVLILLTCFVFPKAHAAGEIDLDYSSKVVTVGSTIKITMRVSDGAGNFKMSSSDSSILSGGGTIFLDNGSQSYTFTAKKVGTVSVRASAVDATAFSDEKAFTGSASVLINVVNKTTSTSSSSSKSSSKSSSNSSNKSTDEDNKSSDNSLKSLSVEGQKFEFNKDTTSYSLSVSNEVEKIKISAEASDSKAKVDGAGEKSVKVGDNKFDIVVTAENGDKKTYTINVNVDSAPIVVTVDGKDYTLIKKQEEMPELDIEHEDLTLNFNGVDVPAYRIDKINYVLVALKDENGIVKLYKYDSYKDNEKPEEYSLFTHFVTNQLFISYLDFPKKLIPDGFKKYKVMINGEEVEVYKLSKNSNYCLFYGLNIETGKKNIYKYDKVEKTIQIYDDEELDVLNDQIQEFKYVIVGLIGLCALFLIIIVIMFATRRRKIKKLIRKYETKKMAQI